MFVDIALDITCLHLCNTSRIIFVDIMVGAVIALRPHDCCMWLIILLSQTHSREASYSVTILE